MNPDSQTPFVSFHHLSLRPAARATDLRLMARAGLRDVDGLRHASTAICGAKTHRGLAMPPSPRDRAIAAFWDDRDAYMRFRQGRVFQRWQAAGELYSVGIEPFASRGEWGGRNVLSELPRTGAMSGPIAVLTWAHIPIRRLPYWHLRALPGTARQLAQAPGLVAATGGATPSLRLTFTGSFWADGHDMLSAIYGQTPHASSAAWAKDLMPTAFVRGRVVESDGLWRGVDPLADALGVVKARSHD